MGKRAQMRRNRKNAHKAQVRVESIVRAVLNESPYIEGPDGLMYSTDPHSAIWLF